MVIAAGEKLKLTPAECAMVGDTIYDAQACRAAGVVFLGLVSGGTPEELLKAGAWRRLAGHRPPLADLDHALDVASSAAATSD